MYYYEVVCLNAPEYIKQYINKHQLTTSTPNNNDNNNFYSNQDQECIAVGLATKSFSLENKMPGWTSTSYGYHGKIKWPNFCINIIILK